MDLEDIMFSEISQAQTNNSGTHLHIESNNFELIEAEMKSSYQGIGIGEMGWYSKGINFWL
jgi:hypothetical protein